MSNNKELQRLRMLIQDQQYDTLLKIRELTQMLDMKQTLFRSIMMKYALIKKKKVGGYVLTEYALEAGYGEIRSATKSYGNTYKFNLYNVRKVLKLLIYHYGAKVKDDQIDANLRCDSKIESKSLITQHVQATEPLPLVEEIDVDLAHHLIEIEERDRTYELTYLKDPFAIEGERGCIHVGNKVYHSCMPRVSRSHNRE